MSLHGVEQTGAPKGELTKSAKEVKAEMDMAYAELRDIEDQEGAQSLISLANKIIKKEAIPKEMIDFRIGLAAARSTLIADAGLTPRQITIRERFIAKLEPAVTATQSAIPASQGPALG